MGVPDPDRDGQFYKDVVIRRLAAHVIDVAAVFALWFVVLVLGAALSVLTLGIAGPIMFVALMCTDFVYRWTFLRNRSATMGMYITGIEVRDAEGEKCTPGFAFLHTAAFYVTVMFLPLMIIGWLLMASSPYRRVMHDMFLGSVVINRPK